MPVVLSGIAPRRHFRLDNGAKLENKAKILNCVYWATPSLLCLLLYWQSFEVWFADDDFAFLGLLAGIHSWHDLMYAVFRPTGQGTLRILTDRINFIVLSWLFGPHTALPFRVVNFATQCANLILISAITLRLAGSRLAGWLAPVLWIANCKLATLMCWTSMYDYALCGLCLLTAFWCLLRWIDTGLAPYKRAMWAAYLTGFLALEAMVVFPALAVLYTILFARKFVRSALWLFVPAVAFMVIHELLIPKQTEGPYAARINPGMLRGLWRYWRSAVAPSYFRADFGMATNMAVLGVILATAGLLIFAVYQAFRRNWLPAFFLAWFVIVIGPFLPFQLHLTDYYITLPSIGVAMLSAYICAMAWRQEMWWKLAVVVPLALVLVPSVASIPAETTAWRMRTQQVHRMVELVIREHRANPNSSILLVGLPDYLARQLRHRPFYPFGVGLGVVYGPEDLRLSPDAVEAARQAGRLQVIRFDRKL